MLCFLSPRGFFHKNDLITMFLVLFYKILYYQLYQAILTKNISIINTYRHFKGRPKFENGLKK